jgi:lipopolysaccharide transport system permease protein
MISYISKVYNSRYFWWHLAMADIRAKYRRSYLGIFWGILQPLAMTGLLSFVMAHIFKMEMKTFAPYIFSGMVFWEFFCFCATNGCLSITNAASYILQFKQPMTIYPLRATITAFINMLFGMSGLLVWCLIIFPENAGICWVSIIPAFFMYMIIGWMYSIITGFWGVRFHDLIPMLGLFMQALWFASPIYFPVATFKIPALRPFLVYNPIYHLLELIRAPLLSGEWATTTNWLWGAGTFLAFAIFAGATTKKLEKTTIYYF